MFGALLGRPRRHTQEFTPVKRSASSLSQPNLHWDRWLPGQTKKKKERKRKYDPYLCGLTERRGPHCFSSKEKAAHLVMSREMNSRQLCFPLKKTRRKNQQPFSFSLSHVTIAQEGIYCCESVDHEACDGLSMWHWVVLGRHFTQIRGVHTWGLGIEAPQYFCQFQGSRKVGLVPHPKQRLWIWQQNLVTPDVPDPTSSGISVNYGDTEASIEWLCFPLKKDRGKTATV